jgi:phage terminase large subunit-like protein
MRCARQGKVSCPPEPVVPACCRQGPVLTCCISNVISKADRRGNLYPTKSRPDQKIDAAVALMMAIGRAMVEDEQAKGLEGFLTNPIFG